MSADKHWRRYVRKRWAEESGITRCLRCAWMFKGSLAEGAVQHRKHRKACDESVADPCDSTDAAWATCST
jgi:hypothetical protein